MHCSTLSCFNFGVMSYIRIASCSLRLSSIPNLGSGARSQVGPKPTSAQTKLHLGGRSGGYDSGSKTNKKKSEGRKLLYNRDSGGPGALPIRPPPQHIQAQSRQGIKDTQITTSFQYYFHQRVQSRHRRNGTEFRLQKESGASGTGKGAREKSVPFRVKNNFPRGE